MLNSTLRGLNDDFVQRMSQENINVRETLLNIEQLPKIKQRKVIKAIHNAQCGDVKSLKKKAIKMKSKK